MKEERIPRPLGLTKKVHATIGHEQRQELIKKEMTREYIRNDYMFQGRRVSLEHYSAITSIPIHQVQDIMVMEASRLNEAMDNEGLTNTLRAITQGLFRGALVDRNIAITQYSMLANQQQDRYVPFLTSAVNESIRSLFASNDQTLKILKALLPSNGIEALNQGGLSSLTNGTSDPNTMTVAKAVELMKQQGPKPLLEAPDTIKALEEKHNLAMMPEVVASRQSGYDASNEGLDFDKLADKQLEAMKNAHENRRAHQEGHDLDSDYIDDIEPEI